MGAFTRIDGVEMKKYLPAIGVGFFVLLVWQGIVYTMSIPKYLFPSPLNVILALRKHGFYMLVNLSITMEIAVTAFVISVVVGVVTSFVMVQSQKLENAIFPYVIIVQVTPIVALAPLIVLLVKDTFWALVLCAVLISIFPVISNTTLGLKSVSPGLIALFKMYQAGRWQTLLRLRVKSALPYFFGSLKITAGLSIVGAVVGGFVAGTSGANSGLAYDILQDGYNLEVSQMFASVFLLAVAGVAFFALMTFVNWFFLHKWHDSVVSQED
ncbi:MAG: ABC transporter permease [Candidatus Dormibacteria bacterium]